MIGNSSPMALLAPMAALAIFNYFSTNFPEELLAYTSGAYTSISESV
jgi:hypothetical protein